MMIINIPFAMKLVLYETIFGCYKFFKRFTSIRAPSYSFFSNDPIKIFLAMYSLPPSCLFFTRYAAPITTALHFGVKFTKVSSSDALDLLVFKLIS